MLHENPALLLRNATFADATLTRRADIRPESFDEANRTVEAVISTGADYPRRDARGPFVERLDLSAIRTVELVGLPVLDGHRQGGSEHVVGTIIAASRNASAIVATIRLSEADDVRSAVTKVREGVLRGVSIGYRVSTWEDGTDANGARVRTAKSWRIHEVSLVSVPADAGAVVRSENMPEVIEEPNPAQTRTELRAQVRTIARNAGLTPEWADQQIDADADLTAVRAAAFEAMQARTAPTIRTRAIGGDDPSARINAQRMPTSR